METICLREILEAVGGALLGGFDDLDRVVAHVDTDSRAIHEGSLFIPLEGEQFDGHAFIQSALEGGAVGCLTARERESYLPDKFYIKVRSTRRALRDLAKYYKGKFDIPFVAVTGSVGKTTTKDMVAAVLGEKYRVLKTEGNFNNDIGLPLTLLRLGREHEIGVVELGMNHAGEIELLSSVVEPDVALITNVGDAHIEHLGSRENILKAKCEIFAHLKPGGLAVLNGDDELLAPLKGTLPRAVTCGISEGADYFADEVAADGEARMTCRLHTPACRCQLTIPALGEHMVYPALMAAAVAERFGLTCEEICRGVQRFLPTKMRMNILRRGGDIIVLNDAYNANPQSMRAAAAVLGGAAAERRRVAVLGDMMELGTSSDAFHYAVGGYFAEAGTDCLIAVGEQARHIADGALAGGVGQVYYFHSAQDALETLSRELRPGASILIKASRAMAFEGFVQYILDHTPEPEDKRDAP